MKLIRILNSMFNRAEVNLKDTIKESLYWLEETRRKCKLGGAWWDKSKNKPEIGGIFLKFEYFSFNEIPYSLFFQLPTITNWLSDNKLNASRIL